MTFDLETAAAYLQMSAYSLREKAAAGIIPGAKPGKSWVFRKERLDEYLDEISPCQSIKSGTPGTSISVRPRVELDALLEQQIGKRRRNTTTNSRRAHGVKTG